MPRAIDQAKALNEDLERMRRKACSLAFELKRIVRALQAAEGRDAEPVRLDEMAREISLGPGALEGPGHSTRTRTGPWALSAASLGADAACP